jgi:hypothetical protein
MKKLFFAVFFLGFAFNAFGADDKAIIATTDDGRKVVLLPNFTWQWLDAKPSAPKASTDKDWQKIITYFGQQGYSMKTVNDNSKTFQTDWHNQIVPRLAYTWTGGLVPVNNTRSVFLKATYPCVIGWSITGTLNDTGPVFNFQYRAENLNRNVNDPFYSTPITLDDKFCKDKRAADACEKIKANEKAIADDITALIKPAGQE